MEFAREQFLKDAFHGITLAAISQRGGIYLKGLTEAQRSPFQGGLRRNLDRISARYARSVSEARHIEYIAELADVITRQHAPVLAERRFRIGSAQKALNLYLKCLWCAGLVPTPPHCPFDRRIIKRLLAADRCNWTVIDGIDEYRRLVAAAKKLAGTRPLAEWELELYNSVSVAGVRRAQHPLP
jgi:hypothetical protein